MGRRPRMTQEEWNSLAMIARKLGVELEKLKVESATFAEMESVAHQLGQVIAQATSEKFATQRTETAEPKYACPGCGCMCKTESRERDFTTVDGPIDLVEPRCHCPACRRDFFPSASANAS